MAVVFAFGEKDHLYTQKPDHLRARTHTQTLVETTLKTCIFHAICSILELETAISTVFATVFELEPFIFHGICNILVVEIRYFETN